MATPPFLPDETLPGASDLVSAYPAVSQAFRDIIESWLLIEHNTNGTHKQVTLDDIATPTIAANLVGIWHESGVLKTRFAAGTVYDLLTSNTGVLKDGDTMTGLLVLSGDAGAALGAATKQQMDTADALKAPLASPTLTGDPKAPTPAAGDNDVSIATTAFVQSALPTLQTKKALTSGSTSTYSSLSAGLTKIEIMISKASCSAAPRLAVRIGDSGGIDSADYFGSVSEGTDATPFSTEFLLTEFGNATWEWTGWVVLQQLADDKWLLSSSLSRGIDDEEINVAVGEHVLASGDITDVQLLWDDTGDFDGSGEWNIRVS